MRLEAGLHALLYYGAHRYPSYAYHDLPQWHSSHYQSGAHLLPLLRADLHMGAVQLTLGDLHGHTQHRLALPLYNPQSLISTDPERGVQLRIATSRYQLDSWVDWQSFIFDQSPHQEVFVFGLSQQIHLSRPRLQGFSFSLPLQVVAQHRGGEQDNPDGAVQTLANAALGLDVRWQRPHGLLRQVDGQLLGLLSYQQAGRLWPFTTGTAFWAQVSSRWQLSASQQLQLSLGALHAPRQFATLLGAPFWGTLSLKHPGSVFAHATTAHWQVAWQRSFGPRITLSAYALGYLTTATTLTAPDGLAQRIPMATPFTLGAVLGLRI